MSVDFQNARPPTAPTLPLQLRGYGRPTGSSSTKVYRSPVSLKGLTATYGNGLRATAAPFPFPVHVHMLRHPTGYALAARGMDTRRLQHFLGHASTTNTVRYTAMSPEPFKDIWR